MIHTISLCPTCYKKIPAVIYPENGVSYMEKTCEAHGDFKAVVERDASFVSNFYNPGTLGNNNSIILHINNSCNMDCSWCYYGKEEMHDFFWYDTLLREMYPGYSWMLSGGEPTERPDYFEFVKQANLFGWNPSTITNMINLADDKFFKKTLTDDFIDSTRTLRFAMSFQHPKNYSEEEYAKKLKALENIERAGLKAACVMFSVQTLDELDFIKEFYDKTKHLYEMMRVRTMFHNWQNAGEKDLFLSDLHRAFLHRFEEYSPIQSKRIEQSNIYCSYMMTNEGRHVSLASSPTVENIDYHLCSRPVFMLGPDNKCYPVPIAQIVNEGIEKGWKDGYKLEETQCGQ